MTPDELSAIRGNLGRSVRLSLIATVVLGGLTWAALQWGNSGIEVAGILLGVPATTLGLIIWIRVWVKLRGAEGGKQTAWAEGTIGLSDRPSSKARISEIVFTLWLGDKPLTIPEKVYRLMSHHSTQTKLPGHQRSTFEGAVQYVVHSGLVLRVRSAEAGVIYELPGLPPLGAARSV